jgi:hypothetical protein
MTCICRTWRLAVRSFLLLPNAPVVQAQLDIRDHFAWLAGRRGPQVDTRGHRTQQSLHFETLDQDDGYMMLALGIIAECSASRPAGWLPR